MNVKNLFLAFSVILTSLMMACSDDDVSNPLYTVRLDAQAPEALQGRAFRWLEGRLVMTEINTGKKTEFSLPADAFSLDAGQYRVSIEGKISVSAQDGGQEECLQVRGSAENITVNKTDDVIRVDLVIYSSTSGFVFSEIYVTGDVGAGGTRVFFGDKFFKIYNNSDTVQYADGLALLESTLTCTFSFKYGNDPRKEGFAAQVVYVIPGNGTEYPVEPGESIVITDQAANHYSDSTRNQIDMSGADFEWYDPNDKVLDPDNGEVPNLEKWYSYSKTIWSPNVQANKAYALARIRTDKEDFLKNNYHDHDWDYTSTTGKTMYSKGYLIPNDWVLDAVNLCPKLEFNMLATSDVLDKSFISVSDAHNSPEKNGKSVQRKVAGQLPRKDGKGSYTALLDTNDSANDFVVDRVSYKKK